MKDKSFVWDIAKAITNLRKHGVSFEEGATVFKDPLARLIPDTDHSESESRWLLVGISERTRVLIVVHVEYEERIRIISVRKATRREREDYEEN